MNYYIIQAKIGHQGCGESKITSFYTYGDDIFDAINKIRTMPAVKHDQDIPFSKAEKIDESTFVKHIIKNAYYNCFTNNNSNASEYNSLEKVAKIIGPILSEFKTAEGKYLASLCYRYFKATDDRTKIKLCQEYRRWINNIENNDNLNF